MVQRDAGKGSPVAREQTQQKSRSSGGSVPERLKGF